MSSNYLPKDRAEDIEVVELSNAGSQTGEESPNRQRESWGSKVDFLLSVVGFAVDLANVWRFPYLCYKYGGGAFLIPYLLMNIFQAVPLLYMELLLGQINQKGPIAVWDICPIARGLGLAQNLMSYLVAFYYNVIVGWCFLYLFNSLSVTDTLPWMKCDNGFNTRWCVTVEQYRNLSAQNLSDNAVLASEEFFERGVLGLHQSSGIDQLGSPKLGLVICCFVVFTCLYFSLWRGVKTSGKVVYVTATLPYILMLILVGNGARLPGAAKGIAYFIIPDVSKLNSIEPWIEAAIQVFYSTGAGFGVHLSLASYSNKNNNCYRDSLIATGANVVASFLAGFVVFSYLGFMSEVTGKPIEQVTTEGPGLVFQVYPVAIGTLPMAPLWSILFFGLLITLGLDSAMGGMESVLTGLGDYLQKAFGKCRFFREIFTAIVVYAAFLVSILLCTPGGMYLWNLFNNFSAGLSIIAVAFTQAFVVSWIYGLDQFCRDVKENLGLAPGIYWRLCWKFVAPIFISVIIVFNCISLADPSSFLYVYQYTEYHPELFPNRTADGIYTYQYPMSGKIVGWVMCFAQIALIPLVAVVAVVYYRSFAKAITPVRDHDLVSQGLVSRYTLHHWFTLGPRNTFPLSLCRKQDRTPEANNLAQLSGNGRSREESHHSSVNNRINGSSNRAYEFDP